MAERWTLRRRAGLRRPELALSAVAIGAVSAAMGVASATASPDYPSWDEVQNAKRDEASKQAEIAALTDLVTGLENAAAEAGKKQQIADEKYRVAADALEKATARETELHARAADAEKRATVSKMRAGLLAAHLARTGGGDVNLSLALDGNPAGLLDQLSAVGKLSEQSRAIYDSAVAERNLATSLRGQAEAAKSARARLASDAKDTLAAATAAAGRTRSAVADQESRQAQLFAQLATLKNTTAEAEAAYRQGQTAAAASAARAAPSASAAVGSGAASGSGSGSSSGSASGGTTAGSGGSAPSAAPAPAAPAPPPAPAPAPAAPAAPAAPSPSAVSGAIAFARAQIGDMYQMNGYGPDVWDCSGLTKAAYASVGIYIGTHSATNQYDYAAANGRLVPYSQRQPGDLIFYTDGGGDMYHVTIYSGGGRMIEAPYDGVPVREVPVRDYDRVGYVARPSA